AATAGASVGSPEVGHGRAVAVPVKTEPLDRVLDVVAEEVAALVLARELSSPVDETACYRGVAPAVRIGVDRARHPGQTADPLAVRPAVVRSASANVHFLERGGGIIPPHVP